MLLSLSCSLIFKICSYNSLYLYSQGIRCAEPAFLWSSAQMATVAAAAEGYTACPRFLSKRFGLGGTLCGGYRTSTYLLALLLGGACGTGAARCTHQAGGHVHWSARIAGPQSGL